MENGRRGSVTRRMNQSTDVGSKCREMQILRADFMLWRIGINGKRIRNRSHDRRIQKAISVMSSETA
jgi:hypothetical protein